MQPDTILIVEDHTDTREGMCQMLQSAGFIVETASNGREALALLFRGLRPCVIVMDLMMPVMNGWQFAAAFHAKYGHGAPIVIATAAEHVHSAGNGIDPVGVLPKPFEVSDLLRVVARHVHVPAPTGAGAGAP